MPDAANKRDVVLVIHGMGTHPQDDTRKFINDGINLAVKRFGFEKFNFEKEVELIEFNYSEFLDKVRNKDANYADTMSKHLSFLAGHGLAANIVSELTEFFAVFDEDKALYTHWMDVLYYGETFWGEKIRVDLAVKLNQVLKNANIKAQSVHIIAHSLGTAVLHDTLAEIYDPDSAVRNKVPNLDPNLFFVDSLFQIANVSRLVHLLSEVDDPLISIVHPHADGCCKVMYNVHNTFDPFTWLLPYNRPLNRGGDTEIKTVRVVNTHDIQEYMEAPPVAKSILNTVLSKKVSKENYDKAVSEHGKTSVTTSFEELQKAFKDIKNNATAAGKIEALKVFFSTAKDFKGLAEKILK